MGRWILIVVAACGPSVTRQEPTKLTMQASQAPGATVTPTISRESIVAELSERIQREPLIVLRELGVRDDQFEPLARLLYNDWRRLYPDRAAAMLAKPTPEPPKPTVFIEPSRDSIDALTPWWCFHARENIMDAAGKFAACFRTKDQCAGLVTKMNQAPGLNVVGGGADECYQQDRAACFTKHVKLYDVDEDDCAPSFDACEATRDYTIKHFAADYKVISKCSVALK